MFRKSTDGEHGRDGGEHALINAEQEGGNLWASNGGLRKHPLEAKVTCDGC